MNKINVLRIVADHFRTLRDFQTGKLALSDLFTFLGLPLVCAAASVYFKITFTSDVLISILTAFSIFAGLLFSLLLLVFSLTDKFDPQSMLFALRKQLFAELYENISFAILISMAIVTLTLIAGVRKEGVTGEFHTGRIITSSLVFLMINFILTILMVLKRMHALLMQALKDKPLRKSA
jgi:hypothetical protein